MPHTHYLSPVIYDLYTTEQLLANKAALQTQYDGNTLRISEITAENVEITAAIAVIDNILTDNVTPTPTDLTATLNYPDIDITWTDVASTTYTLERATVSNYADAEIIYSGGTTSYTDDSTKTVGTTYYYRVKGSFAGKTDSEYATTSIAYLTQLDSPVVIDLQQVSASVKGAFNYVDNAVSYNIYRSTTSLFADATLLQSTVISPFADDTVVADEYWYWVIAHNDFYIDSEPSAFGSIVVT